MKNEIYLNGSSKRILVVFFVFSFSMLIGCEDRVSQARNEGYREGKQDGYNNGYNTGYSEGKRIGFDNGHSAGYSKGKKIGYDKGNSAGYLKGKNVGYKNGHSTGYTEGKQKGIVVAVSKNGVPTIALAILIILFIFAFVFLYRFLKKPLNETISKAIDHIEEHRNRKNTIKKIQHHKKVIPELAHLSAEQSLNKIINEIQNDIDNLQTSEDITIFKNNLKRKYTDSKSKEARKIIEESFKFIEKISKSKNLSGDEKSKLYANLENKFKLKWSKL